MAKKAETAPEGENTRVCPKCGYKQMYSRIDNTRRCSICGYDDRKEVKA